MLLSDKLFFMALAAISGVMFIFLVLLQFLPTYLPSLPFQYVVLSLSGTSSLLSFYKTIRPTSTKEMRTAMKLHDFNQRVKELEWSLKDGSIGVPAFIAQLRIEADKLLC